MSAAYKAVIPQNICFYGEDRKVRFRAPLFFFSKDRKKKKSSHILLYNTLVTFIVGKLMYP